METAEASKDNEFKKCGRVGRRGACIEVEIPPEKLKQIMQKANENFDDGGEGKEIQKENNV